MRRNKVQSRSAATSAVPSEAVAPANQPRTSQAPSASAESGPPNQEPGFGEQPADVPKPDKIEAPVATQRQSSQPGPDLKIPPILLEGDDPIISPPSEQVRPSPSEPGPPANSTEPPKQLLPETYDTGRLLLAARDPHAVYLHWDVSSEQRHQLKGAQLAHPLYVRLLPSDAPGAATTEIRVPPDSREWFIHAPRAAAQYVAELGYYEPADHWRALGKSNSVRTPPEGTAGEKPITFATFPMHVPLGQAPSSPSTQTARQGGSAPVQGTENLRAAIQNLVRSAEAHPPSAAMPDELSPASALPDPVVPVAPALGSAPMGSVSVSEWTPEQERELSELVGWTRTTGEWLSSAQLPELVLGRPPVSLAPVVFAESMPLSVSSPSGGEQPAPQGFWLNVNAELVVYGATDPSARVTLGGQVVQLRPDGTFSVRFALPDGAYGLPIEAVSTQGEGRLVNLSFTRATLCRGEVGVHPQDPALKKIEPGTRS